jgi:hypothetical protein
MTYYGDEAFPSPSDEQWARLQSYGSAQEVESGALPWGAADDRWAGEREQLLVSAWLTALRSAGGDTKTRKSRRGLQLPRLVVAALAAHKKLQEAAEAKAGEAWTETGAVFTSRVGTPLDAGNVRRQFKDITERAGLGRGWAPRELRHSFVSLMSEQGVTLEQIADLVGHSGTKTTELPRRCCAATAPAPAAHEPAAATTASPNTREAPPQLLLRSPGGRGTSPCGTSRGRACRHTGQEPTPVVDGAQTGSPCPVVLSSRRARPVLRLTLMAPLYVKRPFPGLDSVCRSSPPSSRVRLTAVAVRP